MINTIQDALNKQMNAEFYSEYLYLSMAAYFESKALHGFAHWMLCQTQEEHMHGMKFFDYIHDRGGRASVSSMEGPPTDWVSPLAVLEHTYEHEKKVTGMINDLVDLSIAEKDHATNSFLHWFVTEQVEEEASASAIVENLRLVEGSKGGLLMIDKELATRVPLHPINIGGQSDNGSNTG